MLRWCGLVMRWGRILRYAQNDRGKDPSPSHSQQYTPHFVANCGDCVGAMFLLTLLRRGHTGTQRTNRAGDTPGEEDGDVQAGEYGPRAPRNRGSDRHRAATGRAHRLWAAPARADGTARPLSCDVPTVPGECASRWRRRREGHQLVRTPGNHSVATPPISSPGTRDFPTVAARHFC
jgi:hypothetical protein